MINIDDVINLEVEGVDSKDYPDFCDAYFVSGYWSDTGKELTEEQLEMLGEKYPEALNEMAYDSLI